MSRSVQCVVKVKKKKLSLANPILSGGVILRVLSVMSIKSFFFVSSCFTSFLLSSRTLYSVNGALTAPKEHVLAAL